MISLWEAKITNPSFHKTLQTFSDFESDIRAFYIWFEGIHYSDDPFNMQKAHEYINHIRDRHGALFHIYLQSDYARHKTQIQCMTHVITALAHHPTCERDMCAGDCAKGMLQEHKGQLNVTQAKLAFANSRNMLLSTEHSNDVKILANISIFDVHPLYYAENHIDTMARDTRVGKEIYHHAVRYMRDFMQEKHPQPMQEHMLHQLKHMAALQLLHHLTETTGTMCEADYPMTLARNQRNWTNDTVQAQSIHDVISNSLTRHTPRNITFEAEETITPLTQWITPPEEDFIVQTLAPNIMNKIHEAMNRKLPNTFLSKTQTRIAQIEAIITSRSTALDLQYPSLLNLIPEEIMLHLLLWKRGHVDNFLWDTPSLLHANKAVMQKMKLRALLKVAYLGNIT